MGFAQRLPAVLPLLAIVFLAPAGQAQAVATTVEDWNDYSSGIYPPIPEAERVEGWTYGTTGTVSKTLDLSTAQNLGGRSLHLGAVSSGSNNVYVTPSIGFGTTLGCDGTSATSIEFDIYIDAVPTGDKSDPFDIKFTTSDPDAYWGVNFPNSAGLSVNLNINTDGGAGVEAGFGTLTEDIWWHFYGTSFNCAAESFSACFSHSNDGSAEFCAVVDGSPVGTTLPISGVLVQQNSNTGAVDTWGNTYLENITITSPTTQPGNLFCAEPLEEDFGYNYVRGPVEYSENIVADGDFAAFASDFNDGFVFEGDENFAEWGVLAKQFSPGTAAAHVEFRIMAAFDGDDSVFRAVFAADTGANLDPDSNGETALGNGLNTGNFADHVEVELTEDGDRWRGKFYYAEPGIASGARTQLGASFLVNVDPNGAVTFDFWFDSRPEATVPSNLTVPGGLTTQTGPFLLLSSPDFSTQVLAYRSFEFTTSGGGGASVAAAFTDVEIFDQWLVGYGTAGTLTNAETALDDPEDTHNSTCIFDDVGTARCVGSCGLTPQFTNTFTGTSTSSQTSSSGTNVLGIDTSVGAASLGVSQAAYNAYLGMIYMFVIGLVFAIPAAIIAVKFQKSLIIVAWSFLAGVVVGFILTAVWGFYEAWMVFVAVLAMMLAVVGLVFLLRRGG